MWRDGTRSILLELTVNASNWPRVCEAIEPLLVAIVRARAAADDMRRTAADEGVGKV
jgi:hypothetical protein